MANAKEREGNTVDGSVVEDQLIVVGGDNRQIATAVPQSQFQQGVPLTREALEIMEDFASLEKAIEAGFAKTTKPGDLAADAIIFDIVDAWLTDFTENGKTEKKICFQIVEQETGIVHTVMQSDDSKGIRRRYATLYTRAKSLGIPKEPLRGYMFVPTEKTFEAGNKAYVLQRAPAMLGSASKA